MSVYAEAKRLHAAGFAVIPLRVRTKIPRIKWKRYKTEFPTGEDVAKWFASGGVGIGVIGGAISGGLEALDFDRHGESDPDPFPPWTERITPSLLRRLVVYQSPGGGWRVCWRYGNPLPKPKDVLARHPSGNPSVELLSEQINVVPGGDPRTHKTGRPYRYCRGHLADVPTLTPDERQELIFAAVDGHDYEPPAKPKGTVKLKSEDGDWWPWSDFNRNGTWDFLTEHGWTEVSGGWCRPGKSGAVSASTAHNPELLHVFSSSCPPFEADRSYSRSTVWAILKHGGDFALSAADLAANGWGRKAKMAQLETKLSAIYGC